MGRLSLPLGRFLGIDIRMHLSMLLLLALAIGSSVSLTGSAARGIALWLGLLLAILIRELVRAIAAAYAGLDLRAIFLLPVGGIMAFSADSAPSSQSTRWIAIAGPIANVTFGLLLAGLSYAFDPHVALIAQPWISLGHILRSLIWTQFVIGAVSLLPTPASARATASKQAADNAKPNGGSGFGRLRIAAPAFSLGGALAMGMIIAGFLMPAYYWLIILGAFMLLGTQLRSSQTLSTSGAESILVSEVVLTEYTLLSSSDTLQGALDRTAHSQQEVFPVVRGDQLVGSIARQTLASRLMAEGDGYLQGSMSRALQMATPTEPLVTALQRATTLGASELIAVVDDGAMVGILTPQSLNRAVHQVKLVRSRTGQN